MNVRMLITPGMIFAAGSFAGAANAATFIDTDYTPTSGGTPIVLEGGTTALGEAQFRFYSSSAPDTVKYEIAADASDPTAGIYYQGTSTAFADPANPAFANTFAYTRSSDPAKTAYGDGNYALRFSADTTLYTGFATVADDGGLIDSITYQSATGGAVPEPATWAMMLLGFGAVGAGMRRRRRHVGAAVLAA